MYCLTKRHLGCFYVLASRQVFVREEPVQVEHFVFRNCNVWVPRFHNEISHTNHTGLCVQKLVDISCVVKAGREVVHFKPLCVDCCREMLRKYDAERQHQKAFHALINTNERVLTCIYTPEKSIRTRCETKAASIGSSRTEPTESPGVYVPVFAYKYIAT